MSKKKQYKANTTFNQRKKMDTRAWQATFRMLPLPLTTCNVTDLADLPCILKLSKSSTLRTLLHNNWHRAWHLEVFSMLLNPSFTHELCTGIMGLTGIVWSLKLSPRCCSAEHGCLPFNSVCCPDDVTAENERWKVSFFLSEFYTVRNSALAQS